jgi:major membrane immunogen (membrane-anchored lipoprotein)
MRALLLTAVVTSLAGLGACGEKPQTLGGVKGDVAAYQGVENSFAAPGWKAGDRTSWEQGLKARAQNTQNEYSKTVNPK